MGTFIRIGFDAIEAQVPAEPGLYEIYTHEGMPLKVGIGGNLRRRLLQHRESRQKYLLLRPGGSWSNPADVTSKRSILAKHLYFANPVTGFDLTTEQGRQQFLLKKCYLQFQVTSTREEARELEKVLEAGVGFSLLAEQKRPHSRGAHDRGNQRMAQRSLTFKLSFKKGSRVNLIFKRIFMLMHTATNVCPFVRTDLLLAQNGFYG